MLGGDVWDVEGYDKVGVEELVGGGYREMSPAVKELFGPQFEECQYDGELPPRCKIDNLGSSWLCLVEAGSVRVAKVPICCQYSLVYTL